MKEVRAMTIRFKMLLMNQFNHLQEELENASNELDMIFCKTGNKQLNSIKTDIIIAKKRVEKFQKLTVKELEKRHELKLKKLRSIKHLNKNSQNS